MTPLDLKSLIDSDPQATAMLLAKDDSACADRCSLLAPHVLRERKVTYLGLTKISFAVAARLSVTMEQMAKTIPLIGDLIMVLQLSDGIDVSDPQTRTMLDQFAAASLPGGITAADSAFIQGLALVQQVVTVLDVEYVRTRL